MLYINGILLESGQAWVNKETREIIRILDISRTIDSSIKIKFKELNPKIDSLGLADIPSYSMMMSQSFREKMKNWNILEEASKEQDYQIY